MSTPDDAPTLRLKLDEAELLAVDYDLPPIEHDLEEQADRERERYDEQIMAALIAPSY